MSVCFLDDLRKDIRILQHGAGLQQVVVPGPVLAICLEQRLLQALQQALLLDVCSGVVDEHAGLNVTAGIDVAVHASAGNAAAHVLAIVLEVHGEDLLAALDAAHLANAILHVRALLDSGHQIGIGTGADRHVMEVPDETAALVDDHVKVLVGADGFHIVARVCNGDAVDQAMRAQLVQRVHNLVERTVAAAAVVGILEAFQGDGERDVAQLADLLAELVVDQACVREDVEHAVVVDLCQFQDVLLANQRFAAGEHEHMRAQALGLVQHLVHLVIGQVQGILVVGGPAAHAMLVAGARGVEQNDPGYVALVLLGIDGGFAQAAERRFIAAVQNQRLQDVGIDFVNQLEQELFPLGARMQACAQAARHTGGGVFQQLAGQVDELVDALFALASGRSMDDRVQCHAEGFTLCRVCDFRLHMHFLLGSPNHRLCCVGDGSPHLRWNSAAYCATFALT